jgi:adenine-specific DNA-methyltransferase
MKKGSKKVAKKVAQKTKKAAKKAAKKAVKKKIAGKVVSKKLPKKTAKKTTKKAAAKKKVIKKNMSEQTEMEIKDEAKVDSVENYQFEPIKGYPMLNWKGKRPFTSTQYYPAQLKENHGEPVDGWMNRIYWGDNLQVMSHMLKEFRGKVDLIYIDPPFASETDFRKTIKLRGTEVKNDENSLEEKQYSDIWANDEYLQFIYERLILMRELLSEKGSIYVHIDQRVSGYIRILCDEVFGKGQFRNWICWKSSPGHADQSFFNNMQNHILLYTKTSQATWNESHQAYDEEYLESHYGKTEPDGRRFEDADLTAYGLKGGGYEYEWKGIKKLWRCPESTMKKHEQKGQLYYTRNGVARYKRYLDQMPGMPTSDLWVDIPRLNSQAKEKVGYPTQKPEALLRRIIDASTNHGDLVFDCFMGSGTTQAVAYKMHRRFIGADINLGSVQTVTKRSIQILKDLAGERTKDITPGVAVYNVNHYDVFRNPIQAKELILEALEIQPLPNNSLYDGEKDGSMVKVMPVNRIATKADLTPLITGFD